MFFWLVFSSAVTGLGVIFEAPGEVRDLKRWWKLKRLGKAVGYWIPVTFIGLTLVIGGIIGEGVFEFLSADAETAIRAHDEQVLGDTIIQAGTAKESAEKAQKAAELAGKASDAAMGKANEAAGKADSVFGMATKATVEAKGALTAAGDAKAQVGEVKASIANVDAKYAPRTLSKIKRDILIEFLRKAPVKPKDPIEISFDVSATDGEAYGKEIASAINDPSTGWTAKPPAAAVGDGDKTGIFLVVRELTSAPPGAVFLQQALKNAGIGGDGITDTRLPVGSLRIAILICRKN
jgi:hypothetical protein